MLRTMHTLWVHSNSISASAFCADCSDKPEGIDCECIDNHSDDSNDDDDNNNDDDNTNDDDSDGDWIYDCSCSATVTYDEFDDVANMCDFDSDATVTYDSEYEHWKLKYHLSFLLCYMVLQKLNIAPEQRSSSFFTA